MLMTWRDGRLASCKCREFSCAGKKHAWLVTWRLATTKSLSDAEQSIPGSTRIITYACYEVHTRSAWYLVWSICRKEKILSSLPPQPAEPPPPLSPPPPPPPPPWLRLWLEGSGLFATKLRLKSRVSSRQNCDICLKTTCFWFSGLSWCRGLKGTYVLYYYPWNKRKPANTSRLQPKESHIQSSVRRGSVGNSENQPKKGLGLVFYYLIVLGLFWVE